MGAEIQWNRSRVASVAPDQTATDSSITFIAANAATPMPHQQFAAGGVGAGGSQGVGVERAASSPRRERADQALRVGRASAVTARASASGSPGPRRRRVRLPAPVRRPRCRRRSGCRAATDHASSPRRGWRAGPVAVRAPRARRRRRGRPPEGQGRVRHAVGRLARGLIKSERRCRNTVPSVGGRARAEVPVAVAKRHGPPRSRARRRLRSAVPSSWRRARPAHGDSKAAGATIRPAVVGEIEAESLVRHGRCARVQPSASWRLAPRVEILAGDVAVLDLEAGEGVDRLLGQRQVDPEDDAERADAMIRNLATGQAAGPSRASLLSPSERAVPL